MRFDVYPMPRGAPYVVDVQSDFSNQLGSRIVIPMVAARNMPQRIAELHPVLEVRGTLYVLVTHQLTSVLKTDLKAPVASFAAHRDEITRALDILLTGF